MLDPTFSNFARAVGINVTQCLTSELVSEIQPSMHNACSDVPANIDLVVVPALIDHSAGVAIHHLLQANIGTVSVDLRTDFFKDRVVGILEAKTQVVAADSTSATMLSQVYDAEGLAAQGTVLLRLGRFPKSSSENELGDFTVDPQSKSLRSTIGLKNRKLGPFYDGNNLSIIGRKEAPAVHGGATVALLMAACQEQAAAISTSGTTNRIASLHVNFARPGLREQAMFSEAEVIRKGKSTSIVMARCFHDSEKVVGTALATIFCND